MEQVTKRYIESLGRPQEHQRVLLRQRDSKIYLSQSLMLAVKPYGSWFGPDKDAYHHLLSYVEFTNMSKEYLKILRKAILTEAEM